MSFYSSTVGKKIVVAATGLLMLAFVLVHMLGNLKVFMGIDPHSGIQHLDAYAEFLRTLGQELIGPYTALWLTRVTLLICVTVHVITVYQLRRLNALARPVQYACSDYESATLASRSMWWGGLFLAFFILFHILHFTTGHMHFDGFMAGQVYHNVHTAFQHWYILAVYLAAMSALYLHVYHGGWSLMQTLGLDGPRRNKCLRYMARGLAVILFIGFMSMPVAIFSGLLPAPQAAQKVEK